VITRFFVSTQIAGSGLRTQIPVPSLVRIKETEYEHDMATVEYWGGDITTDSVASGVPIAITWGNANRSSRVLYGYVNDASRRTSSLSTATELTDRNALVLRCVGASWVLKQAGSASFHEMTIPQVISQIASQFGFSANVAAHPTVWSNLQMAGRTYWAFCVELAKRIGYTFYAINTQLVCKPRQTNPKQLASLAAVYNCKTDPAVMPTFIPTVGANSNFGGLLRNRQLSGIDVRTGQPIFASVNGAGTPTVLGAAADTPVFSSIEHMTVRSQADAEARIAGAGMLNQLYITAEAPGTYGDPAVSKGSLIFVSGANGAQDGLWYVCNALHEINKRLYQTDLDLGRDSTGATATLAVLPPTQALPGSKLVGTSWRAA
jgi:phage protein D